MATCLQIITAAYRKARVRGRGDVLDAEEAADGLITLQSFYDELVSEGAFGRLTDVIISAAYEAQEQERVFNPANTYTVTKVTAVDDGDAEGGVRKPRDLALIVIVGTTTANWIFNSQTGAWVSLSALTDASTAPLSERGADGLACLFSAFIAEENGKVIGPVTGARGMAFRSRLTHRSSAARVPTQAEYF